MDDENTIPVYEKLAIVLPHLQSHNETHAQELDRWAQRARQEGANAVAFEIEEAAKLLLQTVDRLQAALDKLHDTEPQSKGHHHDKSDQSNGHRHDGHHDHHHDHHDHD